MSVPAVQEDWNLDALANDLRDPALTYEAFAQLCYRIGTMHQAVRHMDSELKFAVGDAILCGEQLFGEECYQAIEEMGLSEEARRECVRVSRRVPRSSRRKSLFWSHHRAVASLPPSEQKEWLKKASEEGMSHHEMRDALRNGAEPKAQTSCRCCGRSL